MKSITEIRDWLLENAVDGYGDLMLDGLDFSNFDGNVYIWGMKVQGDLYQHGQEVQGDLYQTNQKVKGNIFADEPKRLLKEITTEELAELGYKLKGEN